MSHAQANQKLFSCQKDINKQFQRDEHLHATLKLKKRHLEWQNENVLSGTNN